MGDPTKDLISPWQPISDPRQLKILGKFLEELGEAVSATARTLIQGIDETEPMTGKPNREWLTEEIADVKGNIDLVIEEFQLSEGIIHTRAERKKINLRKWHENLGNTPFHKP